MRFFYFIFQKTKKIKKLTIFKLSDENLSKYVLCGLCSKKSGAHPKIGFMCLNPLTTIFYLLLFLKFLWLVYN